MNKEDIKKIGEIIDTYFYAPFDGMEEKEYKKWVDKNIDYVYDIDEIENNGLGAATADSLFLICINGSEYIVDIPWNKFYPCDEGLPNPDEVNPDGSYEYLGGWYEF